MSRLNGAIRAWARPRIASPEGLLPPLILGLLVSWRLILPERGMTETGPRALADAAFALVLWAYLLAVGAGVGYNALRLAGFEADHPADRLRFGLPAGLGLLGFIPLTLGLVGFLRAEGLLVALGLTAVVTSPAIRLALTDFRALLTTLASVQGLARSVVLGTIYGTLAFVTLTLALTPPTGYDDLWYHLEGPRLFLQAGRIYPEPFNWPANYAFAGDLLYVFPLALGNDTVPRLLHGTFGLFVLASGYALGVVYSQATAWVIPVALLTMGQFVFLATQAATDFTVSCFELLALELVARHITSSRGLNLKLLSLYLGLGLATKGTAAAGAVAVGVALAVGLGLRLMRGGIAAPPVTPVGILGAVLLGFAIVFPWYAKNWSWFGHPLFPYAGDAPDQDAGLRMQLLTEYLVDGYGLPKTVTGLLQLPVALFTSPIRFGLILPPAALIVLAPFAIFLTRRPPLEIMGFFGVRTVAWFFSTQQIRFLIPALVVLCVLLVGAIGRANPPQLRRIAGGTAIWSAVVLAAYIAFVYGRFIFSSSHWSVIIGYESKESYLTRMLPGFRALNFIRSLPADSRVLLVGDARHYYCPTTCWPEADQFTWTRLAMLAAFEPERLVETLKSMGITHVLVSRPDVEFLSEHDPKGWFRRSVRLLYDLVPRCLEPSFEDQATEVYKLTCPN